MNKYISVHKYAKLKNTSVQNVYRWIREGKFNSEDVRKEEIISERLRINPVMNLFQNGAGGCYDRRLAFTV